jgi:hypothetical protein
MSCAGGEAPLDGFSAEDAEGVAKSAEKESRNRLS